MPEAPCYSDESVVRERSQLVLMGMVALFAVTNSIAIWYWADDDFVQIFIVGVFVAQPILFGVWTALGSGSILMRLPVAAPCLILLFVVPGIAPTAFVDVQRSEFIAAVLAIFAVYTIAVFLFLLLRRLTGFRIQPIASQASNGSNVKFSIKYLLFLITIVSIALGLSTQLKFQASPSSPSILGPNFFIAVLVYGGAILTAIVIPTVAVPLAIMHGHPSRRALALIGIFWVIVISSALAFSIVEGSQPTSDFAATLLAQFGATVAGAIASIALRVAGLRLIR